MTIDQKKAAKSVLIEVWNVLGAFRDEMVLIGGWVPELHYPARGHVGSLDVDIAISGTMPDGFQNRVTVRIVRPEAFILIKAFALDERQKPKDAYDIAFVLRHYRPSLQDLARRIKPLLDTGLGAEAWRILQDKFHTLDSVGPRWAAELAADEAGLDRDQEQQAAFQDFRSLADAMG